jgi:single-strand DNA-binding protein
MLNRWIGIGRLTRDPELRYTPQGTAVCNFTLAINRKFNREETDYIDCKTFKTLAENCANYLKKGSLCAIEGRIQVRTYETQEGQKRKAFEVVADDVRFLDSKKTAGNQQEKPKDDSGWDDMGKEVTLDDIDISGDDTPF